MQLANFLELARVEILAESIAYAKTIGSLKNEEEAVLRNHLPEVLAVIAADLRTPQSRAASLQKSHGLAPATAGSLPTPAENHGLLRARSGLHIEQVTAEYRALRSCVLRLWSEAYPPESDALQDVVRFNEAIDQALAESVRVYAAEVERWHRLFLGILGHDLRSPLNAISLTAEIIVAKAREDFAAPAAILQRSTHHMALLLDSLLEFNRSTLGQGMTINRASIDLEATCKEELELQRAALPDARIELAVEGKTQGEFDGPRVREALGNLVTNAVKHGLPLQPVMVRLEGDDEAVRLTVENATAKNIPASQMEQLFDPLYRGTEQQSGPDRSHLGLGLFIARQIARAHGGEVSGLGSAQKVQFTISLPKRSPHSTEGSGQLSPPNAS